MIDKLIQIVWVVIAIIFIDFSAWGHFQEHHDGNVIFGAIAMQVIIAGCAIIYFWKNWSD